MSTSEIVALVGAPNAGKTTLYNWLTNSKFKTVNYPGATVEYSLGEIAPQFGSGFQVMDTPGTYSLFPKSADEEVTRQALFHPPGLAEPISKVIVVVDGTQLARHLVLVRQLKESGFSLVIAVTMMDLLRKNKLEMHLEVLRREFTCPVIPVEGLLGGGVREIVNDLKLIPAGKPHETSAWTEAEMSLKSKRAQALAEESMGELDAKKNISKIYDQTARVDAWLLHPVGGLFIFAALMFLLFSSILWFAKPFMEAIDAGFSWLGGQVTVLAGSETLVADFLSHGLIASFSAVMIFVPQIFILFFGIGLLEGSGYLARAATLIDRPFSKLGMSGRSFVPLLSGFACAVPALMATRNISSKRDRWITCFIIPMMTCSARLPVYALLLSFLYRDESAWKAGAVLAGIYLLSLVIGAIAAAALHRILAKTQTSIFMMELPLYRRPVLRTLLSGTFHRTQAYVRRAGPAIFFFSVIIWVGTTFPNHQETDASKKLESSYLGRAGQLIEPIFTPMGGDWRTGVGLMSAFAARETFVSSLALLMNVTAEEEEAQTQGLMKAMSEAKNSKGETLFTFSSVMGLIVFFMLAMQCLSTFAMALKEMGSWKFAVTQLVVFNVLAYVISIALVQGLRALGVA